MNDILQYIAVALLVVISAIYLYNHFTRKDSGCDCGDLKNSCKKSKNKDKTKDKTDI